MARVSNAKAKPGDPSDRLIKYLITNKHWSPFEMVNACVYIECPRDISRQILRHRSFSFQEFSGRYAEYSDLAVGREPRMQDRDNRQNSLPLSDIRLAEKWTELVRLVRDQALSAYRTSLDLGIAKEVARSLLPEGLVPTRLYVNGSLRSWIHYWDVRCNPATQKEHREIAEQTREIILEQFPGIAKVLNSLKEQEVAAVGGTS